MEAIILAVSGVGAPPDSYQTLVALYPQVKHWVETGNRLVMESGEVVNTRLEEIVATWLNAVSDFLYDCSKLAAKEIFCRNRPSTLIRSSYWPDCRYVEVIMAGRGR